MTKGSSDTASSCGKEKFTRNLQIKQQLENYFADNEIIQPSKVIPMPVRPQYEREGLLALASETNLNCYVGIDFLITLPSLALLTKDTSVIVAAVENSTCLILSDDSKQIRVLPSAKVSTPVEIYLDNPNDEDSLFMNAIKTNRFITARKLFKRRTNKLNTRTQMDILRKSNMSRKMGLVIKLLTQYNGLSIFNLFRHVLYCDVNPSYVLLLWTIFPKLLLMHEDIIHEPTIFQEAYDTCGPNWWGEVLNRLQQRARQSTAEQNRVTEFEVNSWMPHGDICTIRGVDAAGARVLAKALCSEKIMVIHDRVNCVWVKDVTCSGPSMPNIPRTAFRVLVGGKEENMQVCDTRSIREPLIVAADGREGKETEAVGEEDEGGKVVSQEQEDSMTAPPTRELSADELEYLKGLDPMVLDRTYINWEFYCRDLLESMQRVSGSPVDEVIERLNVIYPLIHTEVCVINGVNAAGARLLAQALCSESIILVHNITTTTLSIIDITGANQITTHIDPTIVTYVVMPSPSNIRKARELTKKELAFLRRLRWRDRRPAVLVAARYRRGQHFNVLKIVAHFL